MKVHDWNPVPGRAASAANHHASTPNLGWILSKSTLSLFNFSLGYFKRKACVFVSVFYPGCLGLYFGKSFLSRGIWQEKTKVTEWRIGERSSARQLQVRQMD